MRNEKSVIYGAWCLCHPDDGVRYVGQTSKGVVSRWGTHLWCARTPSSKSYRSHLSNWIRKHGEDNIAFTVLEHCLTSELDDRERWWIAHYRETGSLVNILEGGGQPRGHKRPEHAEKMRGANNPMYGVDRKEFLDRVRHTGPATPETRAKMSEQRKGESNSNTNLTNEDVMWIRAQPKRYGLMREIGEKYGISPITASAIYRGITWKHLPLRVC